MKTKQIDYIDFAKGFAILAIVIFHYCRPFASGIWSKAIMFGGTGVHLFFVISGFGLALSSQQINIYGFFQKRFIKILIPYFCFVVSIFIFNHFCQIYDNADLYALGGHLFLYKMFDEKIITSFGYHLWFISTIIQFYVFFPAIIRLKNKTTAARFLFLSLIISVSYWVFVASYELYGQRRFDSFFLQYLWEFNAGIILADFYKSNKIGFWEQNVLVMALLATISIAGMGAIVLFFGRVGQIFNDIPASIGFLSLSVVLFSMAKHVNILKYSVQFLGRISYELYLIHMFIYIVMDIAYNNLTRLDSNIFTSFFLALPIVIGLAMMFNILNQKIYTKIALYVRLNGGQNA